MPDSVQSWSSGPDQTGGVASALSPRQRDVAELVAGGLSNKEIAVRLFVAEGTAANHVQAILNRLGLRNRVALAVWVARNGLLGEPKSSSIQLSSGRAVRRTQPSASEVETRIPATL